MNGVLINTNLLKAQMTLRSVTVKAFVDAQGWSMATAYRKINGKVAFMAPEIQLSVELLSLSSTVTSQIFLPAKCPKGQK
ncbi:MAG: hypothetical protein LUF89_01340 [Ruminococcus sp.]|nr:hypothetical protein [Ruminococcus sp.]